MAQTMQPSQQQRREQPKAYRQPNEIVLWVERRFGQPDRLLGFQKPADQYPWPRDHQEEIWLAPGDKELRCQVPLRILGFRIPKTRSVSNRGGRLAINGSVVVFQSRWRLRPGQLVRRR
jgi:hypothetical protein